MDLEVKGCGWRLSLLLSRHFQWKNGDVTGRAQRNDDHSAKTLTLELLITRRPVPSSSVANRVDVPGLIIEVEASPEGCGVRGVQSLYTVIRGSSPSGRLSIIMTASPDFSFNRPWNIGFDFDMDRGRTEPGKKRGTCVIFSCEELPQKASSGQGLGTPGAALLGIRNLGVDKFVDLGDEKAILYSYNNISLWRLAAVGYRR